MSRRRPSLLLALAVLSGTALVAAACGDDDGGSSEPSTTTAPAASLAATTWTLDGTSLDVAGAADAGVTIAFTDTQVSGSSGCNTYTGSYTVEGDTMKFGTLASTQRACEPDTSAIESAYLAALAKVGKYRIEGKTLVLSTASGEALLRFNAVDSSNLLGEWEVVGFLNTPDAFSSIATGTKITAVFAEDGTLAGNGGCNQYNTSYKVTGQAITIGMPASTKKLCPEPADLMTQEQQYFTALPTAASWQLEGTSVVLLNAQGQRLIQYIRPGQG